MESLKFSLRAKISHNFIQKVYLKDTIKGKVLPKTEMIPNLKISSKQLQTQLLCYNEIEIRNKSL